MNSVQPHGHKTLGNKCLLHAEAKRGKEKLSISAFQSLMSPVISLKNEGGDSIVTSQSVGIKLLTLSIHQ